MGVLTTSNCWIKRCNEEQKMKSNRLSTSHIYYNCGYKQRTVMKENKIVQPTSTIIEKMRTFAVKDKEEYNIKPSLVSTDSPSRNKRSTNPKLVAFSTIEIREYPVILGDNPACRDSLPLSLDWGHNEKSNVLQLDKVNLEEPKRSRLRRLTYSERYDRIFQESDSIQIQEMILANRAFKKQQQKRERRRRTAQPKNASEAILDQLRATYFDFEKLVHNV